jgi:hypothetical protein
LSYRFSQSEVIQFAMNLETAQAMFRRYPELVCAPDFPEHLRRAFVDETGFEPSVDCNLGSPVVTDELTQESRWHARDILRSAVQGA